MNVWEFLGLPHDHRTPNKTVMLCKNYDEVTEKNIKYPMYCQLKKDGVFCLVVIHDGKRAMFNRTGKQMTNTKVIKVSNTNDGIYIAELCNELCSLETLSGIVNPNRTKSLSEEQLALLEGLYLAYHDYIPIDEFIDGEYIYDYKHRHAGLTSRMKCEGDELILPYSIIPSQEYMKELADIVCATEEGIVLKQIGQGWVAGHKGFRMMKVVKNVENGHGIDVDLMCIGWEEGTGKYEGKVANLLFRYADGTTVTAMLGKGWTHKMARELFLNIQSGESVPVGQVYRVVGLQPSSKNGLIRLPKVREHRHDKVQGDY